jgi:hypothetical protein
MKKFKVCFMLDGLEGERVIKADFYHVEDGFVHFTEDAELSGEKVTSFPVRLIKSIES